ncbi:ESPR-type extended signal peptide-containing protein, partial [Vreelandella venusta]|uniref:ESPR-type extended signal peptide-containing protein n=1 Tax=Vreelandella venusta TaxID=44935 RepID=UPI0040441DC1
MNNVFRLIWNRTLGRLVVASEAARSRNKAAAQQGVVGQLPAPEMVGGTGVSTLLRPVALAVAIATGSLVVQPLQANVITTTAGGSINCTTGVTGTVGRINPGPTNAQAQDGSGTYSLVAGCNARGNNQLGATVYGAFSQVTGAGGSAFGHNARAAKWATAIGVESRATGNSAIALGFGGQATELNAIAIGSAGGNGTTPLSIANSTTASGQHSIAIGSDNVRGAQASGAKSIALGAQAAAGDDNALAAGVNATASGLSSVSLGHFAISNTEGSIALGRSSEAGMGGPNELHSIAIGTDAQSYAHGIALGKGAVADQFGYDEGNGGIAIGGGAETFGGSVRGVALGNSSKVTDWANDGVAIGTGAIANKESGVALGANSNADTDAGVAGYVPFGATTTDSTNISGTIAQQGAVDIGSRQITSVAAGVELDDAVNVSQLIAAQSKVEAGTNVADVAVTENADGGTIYTVNAEGASVSEGSTAVSVTPTGPDANNVTDYAVDLSQTTKDDIANANKGWDLTVNGEATGENIAPGETADFSEGKNIAITRTDNSIEVATADDVDFSNVNVTNQLDVAGDT